jgi:outer membrane protein
VIFLPRASRYLLQSITAGAFPILLISATFMVPSTLADARSPQRATRYPYLKAPVRVRSLKRLDYPEPILPFEPVRSIQDLAPTETLADALERAYRTNPTLAVRRYELRATDENLAQALSELRPTSQIQVTGNYDKIVPGQRTQATRPLADQLISSIITRNDLSAQVIVDQPLYTGGRATADIVAAGEDIRSGREALRGTEGDLLTRVVTAYVDVRRDTKALDIRKANVNVIEATLAEVRARRFAGELTRTDIAQAEVQYDSARIQYNASVDQLEQSRAAYAALVGANPGVLAQEPPLPQLPRSIDEAFDVAEKDNPELAQAIFAERASRARIVSARAAGRPTLSLRGTAGLNGQAAPFYLYNEDQSFSGRAVLTIPLTAGGRTGSLTAQAKDRNSADRLRIEAARRLMVQNIIGAWNQIVTAGRNLEVQQSQLKAVSVLNEGMYAEYRAGLRSTFDVLFAQNNLRDTQIGLLASHHDLYLAQATLLRHLGKLEVAKMMTSTSLYDPSVHVRQVEHRGRLPWDGVVRTLDPLLAPGARQQRLEQLQRLPVAPLLAPAEPKLPNPPISRKSPETPIPGTTGAPSRRKGP